MLRIVEAVDSPWLRVTLDTGNFLEDPYDRNSQIVEVVITPDSRLLGRRVANTPLATTMENLHVIGMQRRRSHYSERQMSQLRLDVGDILLIQCGTRQLAGLRAMGGLLVVEDVVRTIENRRKGPVAAAISGLIIGWFCVRRTAIYFALLTLAFFYWLVEMAGVRKGFFIFTVVGMNPIFIYLFSNTVGGQWFNGFVKIFSGGFLAWIGVGEAVVAVLSALVILGLEWLLCYWLYKREIFFRI